MTIYPFLLLPEQWICLKMKVMIEMIKMMDDFLAPNLSPLLAHPHSHSFILTSLPLTLILPLCSVSPLFISIFMLFCLSSCRHVDLSNNSLTTLPRETIATAPLLETLVLQANPWSCDCRMNWFFTWIQAHPGD